jgi:3-hydroxymyristoyl/3-hydroxydecanoyl-(acyl carrier protein) dehydratase
MKFRLVDRIISWKPNESITGFKTVSFEEYQLKSFIDVEPHLPESLLLESVLQLGNWLVILSSDFTRMGLVAKITRVCFHDFARPGQRITLKVSLLKQNAEGFLLSGSGHTEDRCIISGLECLATTVPLPDYMDPEDLRVVFSEIGPSLHLDPS